MALTEKQITFARALAAGMTQKEAYVQAYDTKTLNQNTLVANAHKEANKPEVKAYLEKVLKEEYNTVGVMKTRDEAYIRTLLHERLEVCRSKGDETSIVRYAEMLNKMNHTYQTIINDISERDNDISKLSTEELKAYLSKEAAPEVSTYC